MLKTDAAFVYPATSHYIAFGVKLHVLNVNVFCGNEFPALYI